MEYLMKNKIKELRKEKDMTQEELASLVEVTRQTIISLEAGRYNPSLELAYRIKEVLSSENIEDVFFFEELIKKKD
ncbi:MAG: helix-turn-helix transcriptional regulator, partial [Candidatus Nanoarchaeia archaeon]|nr:helix-turn-helix transcriptional regulator [Candidatus Nanoarchaeia archaeon]